jgi:hypothetical protein
MNAIRDRLFQPRLESLEDRCVPATLRDFFPSMTQLAVIPSHKVFSPPPRGTVYRIVKLPPAPVFFPPTFTLGPPVGRSSGLIVNTSFDRGLTTPGLPSYPPSQPATQPPVQSGGLTLKPDGTLSGSLFGGGPSTVSVVPAATPGTPGAVPLLVSTPGLTTHAFTLVPQQSPYGLTNLPAPTAVATRVDPGLTTAGLPSYPPSL